MQTYFAGWGHPLSLMRECTCVASSLTAGTWHYEIGSTAKALAKCMLKYYRISECLAACHEWYGSLTWLTTQALILSPASLASHHLAFFQGSRLSLCNTEL